MTGLLATLLLAWLPVPVHAPSGDAARRPVELADLSLDDRCAIAIKVAQQILNVSEFNRARGNDEDLVRARPAGATRKLNVFISRTAETPVRPPVAIFSKSESCGDVRVGSLYAAGPSVGVALGAGDVGDLPADTTYQLVWSTVRDTGRWDFAWKFDNRVSSCPKATGRTPSVCLTSLPVFADLPTLRITVVKRLDGTFEVESTVLEFIYRDAARFRPPVDAGAR